MNISKVSRVSFGNVHLSKRAKECIACQTPPKSNLTKNLQYKKDLQVAKKILNTGNKGDTILDIEEKIVDEPRLLYQIEDENGDCFTTSDSRVYNSDDVRASFLDSVDGTKCFEVTLKEIGKKCKKVVATWSENSSYFDDKYHSFVNLVDIIKNCDIKEREACLLKYNKKSRNI